MDKIINKIIYLRKNEIDIVNFYYGKEKYKLKIYDLDDKNTIAVRLTSLLEILPKYIYEIKKEDFEEEEADENEEDEEEDDEDDEDDDKEEDEEDDEEEIEEEKEEEITNNIYVGNFLDELKNLMFYFGDIKLKSFYTKNKKIINKLNLNLLNDIAKPYIIYLLGNDDYKEILKYGGTQQYIDEFVKNIGSKKVDFKNLWN